MRGSSSTPSTVTLDVALSLLPADHELVAAAAVGIAVGEQRSAYQQAMKAVALDVAAAAVWRGYAARHVPHEEIVRRRLVPGPLARREGAA